MKFKVNIDFRKGPGFSTEVEATSAKAAEQAAINLAFGCGYSGSPKKVNSYQLTAEVAHG